MLRLLFLLSTIVLFLVSVTSYADVVKPALVEISVHKTTRVTVEIRASIEALLTEINARYKNTQEAPTAKEYDILRALPPEELGQRLEAFRNKFLNNIQLKFDDKPVSLKVLSVDIPEAGYTKVPRISTIQLFSNAPETARQLSWYYPQAFGDNAVRVRQVDQRNKQWHWSEWQWLRGDKTSAPFSLTEIFSKQSAWKRLSSYIILGFEHILPKGLDHILFIIGLFLFSTRLKPLLWQVTMFTVAHTITLGLATMGMISLPDRVVEPLIALSIAYVGFENIWARRLGKHRLVMVFAFGLLHGLGFASVLGEFGMPKDTFLGSLLSFNIGVELGQLAIILICYTLTRRLMREQEIWRRWISVPGSLAIGCLGTLWTFERFLG